MRIELVANFLSFALVAGSWLALLFLIAKFYSPDVLGTFNLVFAFYIFLSQIAGAGIHFSVLRYAAEHRESSTVVGRIARAAIAASLLNATIWVVLFLLLIPLLLPYFSAFDLKEGLLWITGAVFLCGLNKILLGVLNAREEFVVYAIMNSARAVMLVSLTLGFALAGVDGHALPLVISLSEAGLLGLLVARLRTVLLASDAGDFRQWFQKHFAFGYKSVFGAVFIDVNTRVDILVLGLFTSSVALGTYSFAAVLAEGFGQLAVVFRTILNPKLTDAYFNKTPADVQRVAIRFRNMSYLVLVPTGLAVIVLYLPVMNALGLGAEYVDGFAVFSVLMVGSLIGIGYAPMLMIFSQVGMPTTQSQVYIFAFVSNLVLNLILIPQFGILGSAIGTALSGIITAAVLKFVARSRIGIKI